MSIAPNSLIYMQAYGHYLGVGANWDASILLKGVSPTPEDAFLLELFLEGDELRYDEEFILRAYNQRYVAVSDGIFCAHCREKKDASRFRIVPVKPGESLLCSGDTLHLYCGEYPVIIPSFEGGKVLENGTSVESTPVTLICVGDQTKRNQDEEKMDDGFKATDDDEWLDEDDLSLLSEEGTNIASQPGINEDIEDDDAHFMSEAKSFIPLSVPVVHKNDATTDSSIEISPKAHSENVLPSNISVLSSPIFDPVRDRLEEQLQHLLEVRRMDCRLADECQQLLDRCEQLQDSIPRLAQWAERRILLQQSLEQFMEVLPEDARNLFKVETQVLTKIDQVLPAYTGYKDELSVALQKSFGEFQAMLALIGQLQADLEMKKNEITKAGSEADALRGQLRPHLEANQRIATLLPGAQNVIDLLREVEQLLQESDHLLADLLPSQTSGSV